MDETSSQDEILLTFVKALADVDRLRLVGLLAQGAQSLEQIAEALPLSSAEAARHLARLQSAGLVRTEAGSYQLDLQVLSATSRNLLAQERYQSVPEDFEGDAFERKVFDSFLSPDGRLKAIPAQHKKFMVLLRYFVKVFELDTCYSEKQVNEILGVISDDTASLRRAMVDNGLMARQSGVYWRLPD